MTSYFSALRRRPYGSIVGAMLLAALVAGCAQAPLDNGISGSSAPAQIDYQAYPYNVQAGP